MAAERSNRAAVLHGVGDVRLEERAVPEPGPGEVLVEIAAVGVARPWSSEWRPMATRRSRSA